MTTSYMSSPEPPVLPNGYETYPDPPREIASGSGSPCSECSLHSAIMKSMSYVCCDRIRSCHTCTNRFRYFHENHHQPEYFPLCPMDTHPHNGFESHLSTSCLQNGSNITRHPPVNNFNIHTNTYQYHNSPDRFYHPSEVSYTHKPNGAMRSSDTNISSLPSSECLSKEAIPIFENIENGLGVNNNNNNDSEYSGLSGGFDTNGFDGFPSSVRFDEEFKEFKMIEKMKRKMSPKSTAPLPGKRRPTKTTRNNESRKRQAEDLCQVCGDRASGYHYNALTCEGCKGFFRRSITNKATYSCKYGGACEMDTYTRRKCPDCRLKKCREVGMLEECLLTEIQCQSKRRRKKAKIVEVEDISRTQNGASQTTNGDDLSAAEDRLADEAQEIINIVTESFADYRINPEMVRKWENQVHSKTGTPVETCRLADVATVHVQVLVEFTKKLPGFLDLNPEDQIVLLKGSVMQAMLLRNSCGYNHLIKKPNINQFIEETGIAARHLQALFTFFSRMENLRLDETEYALLIAIVVFDSDYPYVQDRHLVDKFQDRFITALIWYTRRRNREKRNLVAKIFDIFTFYRTISHHHTEVVSCWKKRSKLSPLLCEIWDLE